MTTVTGSVHIREKDGSLGSPVAGATISFEPDGNVGNGLKITSGANGRYVARVTPGDYFLSASHPDAGSSKAWINVNSITGNGSRTINLTLPSASARLNTLVAAFPGEIGIHALNLQSGREIAMNADSPMYLASVSKIAIAAGCVDLMNSPSELDDTVTLTLRHHRDEGKEIKYQHLGQPRTVQSLLKTMIEDSDTTATDVLCEKYGINNINASVAELGIDGIRPLSSMIQLDRRRWWLKDRRWASLPEFAFSLYQRHRITGWLDELELDVPDARSREIWEVYLAERRDQATPRAFGELLTRIAEKRLLNAAWKNDILLDTVMTAGTAGRFSGIVGPNRTIDAKGGSHHEVRNQAGLIRKSATDEPIAVLVVFTQRVEFPEANEANAFVRASGDLALQVLGIDLQLSTRSPGPGELLFRDPRPGVSFEQGDRPLIRWASSGVNGPLTLSLEGGEDGDERRIISRNVSNDGEWHSFVFPDNLPSGDLYRFTLSGIDNNSNQVTSNSPRFTVGGTLHVLQPSVGEAVAPGSNPRIQWVSDGVDSRLRLRLLRNQRSVDTFSSNAVDDGEWHSWNVPNDLPSGSGYQIEVKAVNDPNIVDRSGPFSVGGGIDVLAPDSADILEIGSKPTIRWRTRNVIGPLILQLLGEKDDPLETITINARDDGEWHSWNVPNVPDGIGYRILIADRGAPGIFGYSPFFQIGTRYEWLRPSVQQINNVPWNPAARPHYFRFNQTANLQWRRIGPEVGRLRIDLLRNGNIVDTFTRSANDDGEWHSWTPSDNLPPASTYQLRISGRDRPSAFGLSVNFSVGAHIDAHINDLRVKAGDTPNLQWVTEGITGDLTIQLLNRRGEESSRITNRARDDGEWHSWTVPQLPREKQGWYRFRISSNEIPAVFGYTEWFKITG